MVVQDRNNNQHLSWVMTSREALARRHGGRCHALSRLKYLYKLFIVTPHLGSQFHFRYNNKVSWRARNDNTGVTSLAPWPKRNVRHPPFKSNLLPMFLVNHHH
jgi:hypothetical protein